jgi:hypothetical protein
MSWRNGYLARLVLISCIIRNNRVSGNYCTKSTLLPLYNIDLQACIVAYYNYDDVITTAWQVEQNELDKMIICKIDVSKTATTYI